MAHCDFADIVLESGGYLAEFSSANGSGILPPASPCFVDKNAVHGKTLKNDEFFRVFCCFMAKMRLLCFAKTGFGFMLSFSPFRVKTGLEPKRLDSPWII